MSDEACTFSCNCGRLAGHISAEGRKSGLRLLCFCQDCRAAELYHNQPDPVDGVDLFQLAPHAITLTQGAEHLQLMRLGPKGLYRWYADCCGTPFANTLAKPQLAFAGMRSDLFENPDCLGKVRARSAVPQPGKPPRNEGMMRMVYGIFSRMITARLSGMWRQTPFFDSTSGQPVTKAKVLSKEERASLHP
ncbi:DUF6151 family protein [Pseudophaeobacter profundi]|jgi:hypothetical protein|uniref:DUF6151 family protein n=1 Tax=Pseudophaeobacter profundi TaxID=3034152 RepID=UPI00243081A0|nr:DUF6151 family protein [Pseudophaeobacter profundi]